MHRDFHLEFNVAPEQFSALGADRLHHRVLGEA